MVLDGSKEIKPVDHRGQSGNRAGKGPEKPERRQRGRTFEVKEHRRACCHSNESPQRGSIDQQAGSSITVETGDVLKSLVKRRLQRLRKWS